MILNLVKNFLALPKWIRTVLFSAVAILPAYFSALLSVYISGAIEAGNKSLWVHVFILMILSIVFLIAYNVLLYVYDQVLIESTKKKEVLLYAHSLTQRFIIHKQEVCQNRPAVMTDINAMSVQTNENIVKLIENIYNLFESKYAESNEIENRINFEVTYMTKSYEDEKITIPAYANRPKRAPLSMSLRAENPDIYENTITATVYREARPHLHIIEDTSTSERNISRVISGSEE